MCQSSEFSLVPKYYNQFIVAYYWFLVNKSCVCWPLKTLLTPATQIQNQG